MKVTLAEQGTMYFATGEYFLVIEKSQNHLLFIVTITITTTTTTIIIIIIIIIITIIIITLFLSLIHI